MQDSVLKLPTTGQLTLREEKLHEFIHAFIYSFILFPKNYSFVRSAPDAASPGVNEGGALLRGCKLDAVLFRPRPHLDDHHLHYHDDLLVIVCCLVLLRTYGKRRIAIFIRSSEQNGTSEFAFVSRHMDASRVSIIKNYTLLLLLSERSDFRQIFVISDPHLSPAPLLCNIKSLQRIVLRNTKEARDLEETSYLRTTLHVMRRIHL